MAAGGDVCCDAQKPGQCQVQLSHLSGTRYFDYSHKRERFDDVVGQQTCAAAPRSCDTSGLRGARSQPRYAAMAQRSFDRHPPLQEPGVWRGVFARHAASMIPQTVSKDSYMTCAMQAEHASEANVMICELCNQRFHCKGSHTSHMISEHQYRSKCR